MKPDDKICYCYHVSLRKLRHFARRRQLHCPSQMSECLDAGTGCGWCIPTLKRIFETSHAPSPEPFEMGMTPQEYAEKRQTYIKTKAPKNKF